MSNRSPWFHIPTEVRSRPAWDVLYGLLPANVTSVGMILGRNVIRSNFFCSGDGFHWKMDP